jgi:hypothetical protein
MTKELEKRIDKELCDICDSERQHGCGFRMTGEPCTKKDNHAKQIIQDVLSLADGELKDPCEDCNGDNGDTSNCKLICRTYKQYIAAQLVVAAKDLRIAELDSKLALKFNPDWTPDVQQLATEYKAEMDKKDKEIVTLKAIPQQMIKEIQIIINDGMLGKNKTDFPIKLWQSFVSQYTG